MKNITKLGILTAVVTLAACRRSDAQLFAAGVFEATEVIVSAEVTGRILEFNVTEGQELSAGEVVGKLDCRQLELQKEQVVARIKELKSRLADVTTQTAPVTQQLATAEKERKRVVALFAGGAATQKQVDDAEALVAVLRRQETASTQSLTTGNQAIKEGRTAMEVQVEQFEDLIAKCELKSPTAGTVLVKYAQRGEFATPGRTLYKLAQMKDVFLRAYVTADQLTQLKLGQPVKVQADFGTDGSREYDGRIAWISTKSEFTPKTIQTRDERANLVYAVKVAVTNDGFLKIGMYGIIPMGADNAGNSGSKPQ